MWPPPKAVFRSSHLAPWRRSHDQIPVTSAMWPAVKEARRSIFSRKDLRVSLSCSHFSLCLCFCAALKWMIPSIWMFSPGKLWAHFQAPSLRLFNGGSFRGEWGMSVDSFEVLFPWAQVHIQYEMRSPKSDWLCEVNTGLKSFVWRCVRRAKRFIKNRR